MRARAGAELSVPGTYSPAMPTDRLPRGFDEMLATKALIFPPRTFELGKSFEPRPTDVIITPWSKSGTTWLQQIVHGLRSGGDMDFDDISRISPWIEVADALGVDLDADQGWEPRVFKSHYNHHAVPKGCRYIVSFREPHEVMVSYYRFYEGWLFEPGTVSLDEYVGFHLDRSKSKDYWTHIESWWAMRDDPSVLVLSYELMREDLRAHVALVADFLGIEADDALIDLVTHQATRAFMLEHVDKFNDQMHRERAEAVGALPPGAGATKVTSGEPDPVRYRLPDHIEATMEDHWRDAMAAGHAIHSYDQLTEELRGRLRILSDRARRW